MAKRYEESPSLLGHMRFRFPISTSSKIIHRKTLKKEKKRPKVDFIKFAPDKNIFKKNNSSVYLNFYSI